jgi:hypothetical protein
MSIKFSVQQLHDAVVAIRVPYWSRQSDTAISSSHAQFYQFPKGFYSMDIIIVYNDEERTVSKNSTLSAV